MVSMVAIPKATALLSAAVSKMPAFFKNRRRTSAEWLVDHLQLLWHAGGGHAAATLLSESNPRNGEPPITQSSDSAHNLPRLATPACL